MDGEFTSFPLNLLFGGIITIYHLFEIALFTLCSLMFVFVFTFVCVVFYAVASWGLKLVTNVDIELKLRVESNWQVPKLQLHLQ